MTTAAPDLLVSPSPSFPHPQDLWGLLKMQKGEIQVCQEPTAHRCFTGVMPPDSCHSSCEVSNVIPIWWMGALRIRWSGRNMPTTVAVVSLGHNHPRPSGSEGSSPGTWEEKASAEEVAYEDL